MAIRVEIESRLDAERARELWARAATATVFNHPAWWEAAIDAFGHGRSVRVAWVLFDAQPVAVWAFWVKTLGMKETFTRVIEPVGARVTDYVAPVVARGHDTGDIIRRMIETLEPNLDPRTMLLLSKLPAELADGLHLPERALFSHRQRRACPALALPGTMDALEGRLSKRVRGDVRRQIRRLEAKGPLALDVIGERTAVRGRLPLLAALHAKAWGARTGVSELSPGNPMLAFLGRLVDLLPMTLLHYSELRLADETISTHLGFRSNGRLLWYKPAFDLAWQSYSPGKVHIRYAAASAITEGLSELDFLQGTEAYKRDWATHQHETVSIALSRPLAYPFWAWNTKVRRLAAEYRY